MDQVTVTYRGPSGAYAIEHDGEWFEFRAGKDSLVPDALADRLLDVDDGDFDLGDEEASTPEPPSVKPAPDGVNAGLP